MPAVLVQSASLKYVPTVNRHGKAQRHTKKYERYTFTNLTGGSFWLLGVVYALVMDTVHNQKCIFGWGKVKLIPCIVLKNNDAQKTGRTKVLFTRSCIHKHP